MIISVGPAIKAVIEHESAVPELKKETCVAQVFTHLSCGACQEVCPTNAINNYEIDPERCVRCGLCLQVCKVSALANIEMPLRQFRDGWLHVSKTTIISQNEIRYWIANRKIKGVVSGVLNSEVESALHQVNMTLPVQYDHLEYRVEKEVDADKRRLFSLFSSQSNDNLNNRDVDFERADVKVINQLSNIFVVDIDPNKCNGCFACVRVCERGVFSLSESEDTTNKQCFLSVDAGHCNECGRCMAVCFEGAVTVQSRGCCNDVGEVKHLPLVESECQLCKGRFLSTSINQIRCFICLGYSEGHMSGAGN